VPTPANRENGAEVDETREMMMTDEEPPTIECVFSLAGKNFDPADVSKELGIACTNSWRQKRPWLLSREDLPHAAWELGVGPEPCLNLDDALTKLFDSIRDLTDGIREVAQRRRLKPSVVCIIRITLAVPAYVISSRSIAILSALGAELSLDIADLRE
jgi:hypothetical protein